MYRAVWSAYAASVSRPDTHLHFQHHADDLLRSVRIGKNAELSQEVPRLQTVPRFLRVAHGDALKRSHRLLGVADLERRTRRRKARPRLRCFRLAVLGPPGGYRGISEQKR